MLNRLENDPGYIQIIQESVGFKKLMAEARKEAEKARKEVEETRKKDLETFRKRLAEVDEERRLAIAAAKQAALALVQHRFPPLLPFAQEKLDKIQKLDQLQTLLLQLISAPEETTAYNLLSTSGGTSQH